MTSECSQGQSFIVSECIQNGHNSREFLYLKAQPMMSEIDGTLVTTLLTGTDNGWRGEWTHYRSSRGMKGKVRL